MIRLIKSQLVVAAVLLAGVALQPFLSSEKASAVSASDWQSGYIIDDARFTNSSAMTVPQIQSWLDIRLSNCDRNGTKVSELGGGTDYNNDGKVTRAEYGKTYGNPAPFTCLNDYYEVPKTSPGSTTPASNYGKSTIPSGAKSAAQLIYDAGKAYGISPKVLLVKLGTESAGPLTSDTWPFKSQYTYAMGAHCPDSGPGGSANCDSDYAGFSLQMREAAKLLRWYLDNMNESWWPYKKPYTNNHILWNVAETGCGGKDVYIKSKATAALYTYTPYQPNKAALNNMYGTGDGCSAYGNRNFWRVYNDWFGPTVAGSNEGYSAARVTGPGTSSITMESGESKSVSVKYKNTGSRAWYDIDNYSSVGDRPTVLQAVHPNGSSPSGFNSSFASSTRATQKFNRVFDADGVEKTNVDVVLPRETVEFIFTISAPTSLPAGQYAFLYRPVAPVEGANPRVNHDSWSTFYITLTEPERAVDNTSVNKKVPDTSQYGQSGLPYHATRVRGPGMSSVSLVSDSTAPSSVYFKNTGSATWYDTESAITANKRPLVLMFKHINNTSTSAFNAAFPTQTRATQRISGVFSSTGEAIATTPSTIKVLPGEVAEFAFTVTSPSSLIAGEYRAAYTPVIPADGTNKRIELATPDTLYISVTRP